MNQLRDNFEHEKGEKIFQKKLDAINLIFHFLLSSPSEVIIIVASCNFWAHYFRCKFFDDFMRPAEIVY